MLATYGRLPLHFEPNVGQTDGRVRFLARGGGMTAFFTDAETVMLLGRSEQTVVRMRLENAGQPRRMVGLEKMPGVSNYFIGNEPAKWLTDVPHYGRIEYAGVYPGIDVVWYGNQRQLEYDFVVAPGADAKQIQVAYDGVESAKVDAHGDLILLTALGPIRQQKPRVYQEIGGKRVEVGASYAIVARNRVSFELAKYDRRRELRIDPVVLVYSTYLAGNGADFGLGIAVDASGSAYITGYTSSTNFPIVSAAQTSYGGKSDVFVTKLTPAGSGVVYSTYLGGSDADEGAGIAVDGSGSAYVTGFTYSIDFPTTNSPIQRSNGTTNGGTNAFVTKLTPAGSGLMYSTYLGGTKSDYGQGIALDATNAAYVTGVASSADFPLQSAIQGTYGGGSSDAFVAKLSPAGTSLVYSTFLGGSGADGGQGIAVDTSGSAYVTGYTASITDFPHVSYLPGFGVNQGSTDAFVTKLNPAGTGLVYSTYLGGANFDSGHAIAVDAGGSAYVTGYTQSANFPIASAYQSVFQGGSGDAFLTKLAPAGNALTYSTYLGGNGDDQGFGIAVDGTGSAYVTGYTASSNFPIESPIQTSQGGEDVFVTRFNLAGNGLVYSTFLGGSGADIGYAIAIDAAGSAYVTGSTSSINFPTASAYEGPLPGDHAFVSKLSVAAVSPGLSISKSHSGTFAQGQSGAVYTVIVSNGSAAGPSSGTVTVNETIPNGLTIASMSGSGWSCSGSSCNRSDALGAGASYPAITVTVNVASNAPSTVVNQVSVSGGGSATANASDSTTIVPSTTPAVSLATPSGSGAVQTFTGNYYDANGYNDLRWVQMLFAVAPDGGGQTYCFVHYDVQGNRFWLYGDGGFFVGPIAPSTPSNALQNTLCALNTSASTASGSGNTLTVNATVVFKAAAARNIYMRAENLAGTDTGWVTAGTWNLVAATLGTMVASPNSGTSTNGTQQIFTLTYPDPSGFAGAAFGWVQFLVAAATNGGGQPFCFVHYDRGGNGLWMYSSDLGFFLGPIAPGTASNALTSSACSVNTGGASVTNTGGNLVVTVPITMMAPMIGAKNIYQRTLDVLDRDTGWQPSGTWTIQ
jgi:hypothetical protein